MSPIISDEIVHQISKEHFDNCEKIVEEYGCYHKGFTSKDRAMSFEAGAFWAMNIQARRKIENLWPSEYSLFFKLWSPSEGGKPISPVVARRVMDVLKREVIEKYNTQFDPRPSKYDAIYFDIPYPEKSSIFGRLLSFLKQKLILCSWWGRTNAKKLDSERNQETGGSS